MIGRLVLSQTRRQHSLRAFSSVPPRRGPWTLLSQAQRSAWEALGWDAESWEGRRAPPSPKRWSELSSAEQAAAMHGLGYTAKSWNEDMRASDENVRTPARIRDNVSMSKPKSVQATSVRGLDKPKGDSPLTLLKNFVKGIAKVVSPTTVDNMSEPVVVSDVETTLYLDDSPSMKETMDGGFFSPTRLEEAKKVVRSLGPLLDPLPCRVLKFSYQPTVLALRDEEKSADSTSLVVRKEGAVSNLSLSGWDASGMGTYLWHMIEQDVRKRYLPGTGKLRLVVVTDGEDNMSPSGYRGMRGMDPMMKTLQNEGYDIEWHIVVIGADAGSDRYKDLAGATGGSFLEVSESFDEKSRDAKRFLDAVESSGRMNDDKRRERQRQYELDTKRGKAERFDWYKALPPGDKK